MTGTRRIAATLLAALLLALPAGAARADDDDDGGAGGAGASSAGAAGGTPGSEGSAGPGERGPMGAPSTGDPIRDLRGFLGSLVPGIAPVPPAPAPPPPAAAAPRQAPRPPAAPAGTVPGEIAAIGLDAPARARLLAAGFTVIEEVPAVFVPGSIARLRIPRGSSAAAAAATARSLAPAARFDLNHLYRPGSAGVEPASLAQPGPVVPPAAGCVARPVGMIDTAIAEDHPAVAGLRIERVTRRAAGRAASAPAHGTAVAALLGAALGDATIVAVDAFHRRPDGDAADAFDVAAALALLAARPVAVVNLSFAGPDNAVLALATERAAAQGLLLAAAVGNDGQRSPPRFPAAYPWVVAVTAVDRARRPYVRAVRGQHLDFAAPGVGLAAPGGAEARLNGTSYAVPFVSAAFAWAMAGQDRDGALQALVAAAEDLGSPGHDRIFGWGLIRPAGRCETPRLDAAW